MEDVVIRTGVKYLKSKKFNVKEGKGYYTISETKDDYDIRIIKNYDIQVTKDYSFIDIYSSIYNELKNILSADDNTIEVIVKSFISDSLSIPIYKLTDTIVYFPFDLSISGTSITYNG